MITYLPCCCFLHIDPYNSSTSISATEIKMIPSPLSMLLLKETGKISHTMAGDDFPEDPEGNEVHKIKDYFNEKTPIKILLQKQLVDSCSKFL